jgi:hypothetical protein
MTEVCVGAAPTNEFVGCMVGKGLELRDKSWLKVCSLKSVVCSLLCGCPRLKSWGEEYNKRVMCLGVIPTNEFVG